MSELINLSSQASKAIENLTFVEIEKIEIKPIVHQEMRDLVTCIAESYRSNPFHNFEHASHVTMSVIKLMSRIVKPPREEQESAIDESIRATTAKQHDRTFGITSDPLTQFACAFSALIHDADHPGVPNTQLAQENVELAKRFGGRSVAEQNSLHLCFGLLAEPRFQNLRRALFSCDEDQVRFRKLVVNSIMATDIVDKELKELRNGRWKTAFSKTRARKETKETTVNRKATIVLEHLIQASDVSHTMQHWNVYRKWNEKLLEEMYLAYRSGRSTVDPTQNWAKGEIGFFDFYIIPLAKKLKNCGVFGVSSDEYLNYALINRRKWEQEGAEITAKMVERLTQATALGFESEHETDLFAENDE